ncbi:class I SAM-dependent methyltransferase [Roseiconus nitratireducens]|uniref:Class I SAM-dependent methyltransferase n=1 Tax=Roseiconus nitratireducens TaxID=2605748 RepID=A0A5M6CZQ7_9BACT|nr:cyclopropane-fatty-acyl-phospholipid synthase family protein [Roseiconus nitratireducens]KAA5540718.1 class I SAM-dependent methyltransferase [Roseiconus nitratireducens]
MSRKTKAQANQLALARELFAALAEKLDSRISIRLWDGSVVPLGHDPQPGVELSIADPGVIGSLVRRPTPDNLIAHYAQGHLDFHGTDLVSFMELARVKGSRRRSRSISKSLIARVALGFAFAKKTEASNELRFGSEDRRLPNKPADNRAFIQFHYDVSNDFYKLFLDNEMVYSCAYFRDWNESLEQAQQNKLDMICRKLRLQPGDRLLDIGCGWGALLCHAAEHYGVTAHGVTLSDAQLEITRKKIAERGLSGRVTAELRDYIDLGGKFDKVSSIGMAEHVGIDNLPAYMNKIRSLLVPGGLFLNHAITRPAKRTQKAFRRNSAERRLLTKYVFPGGELDHQGHVLDCMESTGFEVHDVEGWRDHYGLTCRHWAERLQANRDQAIAMVGEEKYRMWILYLAGVCMALTDGTARIFQTVASNRVEKGHSGMPPTREHLYADHAARRAA